MKVEYSGQKYQEAIKLGIRITDLEPEEATRRYQEVMRIDGARQRGEISPAKALEMMEKINRGETL